MFAFISPVFLFRAYTMPVTPLLIPVFLYLLCQLSNDPERHHMKENAGSASGHLETSRMQRLKAGLSTCLRWRPQFGRFSGQEVVWITSMVAAGGSFAPAYQWIATIDSDYGHLLSHWQQLAVVLGTQLLGWSLGQMLKRIFVGRNSKASWPDTLPLSFLIQTLFPNTISRCHSQPRYEPEYTDMADDPNITRTNTALFDKGDEPTTQANTLAEAAVSVEKQQSPDSKDRQAYNAAPESSTKRDAQAVTVTRKRTLAFLTSGTFVYHILLTYIAPVFKSFCLLCFANPKSRLLGSLGSGWNGAGILSITFDWAAITTLQPFVTPFWAQIHYLLGSVLMLYVLTPAGWYLDWWGSGGLPIVSTNVFDVAGNVYNITVVDQLGASFRQGPQRIYDPYSPVRLTVNSALAYIVSVAATVAVVMHLALWHSRWSLHAVANMSQALLRLWDPRPLFRSFSRNEEGHKRQPQMQTQMESVSFDATKNTGNSAEVEPTRKSLPSWDIMYIGGRVGRMLVFTAALGVAIVSSQLGITTLPGWQALLAAVWAMLMCIPLGFVEAMTGFTLPMDLLPHIFAGWMGGPGHPIENGYFHLWATVPVRVALGWSGVRGFQLVHNCCFASDKAQHNQQCQNSQYLRGGQQLPWMKRGLLIGLIWGACVNHLSYTAFSNSLEQTQIILPPSPADKAEAPNSTVEATPVLLGWHEEGEFGRLPAALSSELVVWGIVGPKSLFSKNSPYRLLFLYGALVGVGAPLAQFAAHRLLARLSTCDAIAGNTSRKRMAGQLARAAKSIELPLVLTGMVAVPTIPANFVISGLVVAVVAHVWCRRKRTTLVDRSLFNAAMDTGARLAVAVLFGAGQILATQQRALTFATWWGNRVGNVEQCDTRRTTGTSGF
ncbi:OPT super [Coemansia sp. RSA 1933]|nr:OPT super [Coemansia sp. RSA 1933]